jgi:uncharacterized protein YqeY
MITSINNLYMSLQNNISDLIIKSMKAKEKNRLEALRAIKNAILLINTKTADSKELTYTEEIQLLQKLVKQRRESAEIYNSQKRHDLAKLEEDEALIIQDFLPKQLNKSEIEINISKIIDEFNPNGMKDMGRIMRIANNKMEGKADGKTISMILKKLLS